jgi:lipopolysaccharide export system permease protein
VGDKNGDVLKDIWIWELDKQKRVLNSGRAASGKIVFDESASKLVLSLNSLQVEVRDKKDPEDTSKIHSGGASDQATFDLPLGMLTGDRIVQKKLKWFTFPQLMQEWSRLSRPDPAVAKDEQAKQLMRVQITIHEKLATAFSVLSFALVAIPLGIKVSRKETSANLGLGLLLALGYYFASIMAGWLDNYPALRPDLIVWVPNIVFQGLGLWLFYKVDRS